MNLKSYKISVVIVVLASLFLSACKTYEYFNIEVLEPAELFLAPDIQMVAVAHNILIDDTDSAGMPFRVYDMVGNDTVFIDTTLANASIIGLADGLNYAGRLSIVTIDSISRALPKYATEYTNDDVSFIRRLCDDKAAHAFLILNELEHKNAYDIFLDKSGRLYGEFEVIIKTEWLLINPYLSKLIDIKSLVDTLYFQVEPLNFDEKNTGFEAKKEILMEAALATGYKYSSWISPHFVQTSRMVFKTGDKDIKAGFNQASLGNWKNAAWFWRNALASTDPKIKAQACFNLALASEMEGLLKPALGWANESFQYFPDTLSANYIAILEKRIQQQKALILQMDEINVGSD